VSGLAFVASVLRSLAWPVTLNSIDGLAVLRNLAAHGRSDGTSTERARDYVSLADAVLYALRAKAASSTADRGDRPAHADAGHG
jgi:hypothetical protein